FALWGFALAKNGVAKPLAAASALLILWGGGFVFFAGNVAHAPAFFLPLLLLVGATLKKRWWEDEFHTAALATAFGALTLWLDMLFEAIPFNTLMLGLTFLLLLPQARLRRLLILLGAFADGVLGMLALKLLCIGLLSGWGSLDDMFLHPLGRRMAWQTDTGDSINYAALIFAHLPKDAAKIYGAVPVWLSFAAAGIASFFIAFLQKPPARWGYALLMLVVPVWYALLPEHSWVHSGFSTRLLFWVPALGLILLASTRQASKIKREGLKT
ncbi:MAG TPA: hypothetical protein VHB73_08425, partial [Alphaproteobacteria bacterium]|nr:hypothetical protein [Alphaproteobacteria bacterium]